LLALGKFAILMIYLADDLPDPLPIAACESEKLLAQRGTLPVLDNWRALEP